MVPQAPKQLVLSIIERLPEDVSLEQIMEAVRVVVKVEAGLAQLERGDTLTHEQVRERLRRPS